MRKFQFLYMHVKGYRPYQGKLVIFLSQCFDNNNVPGLICCFNWHLNCFAGSPKYTQIHPVLN